MTAVLDSSALVAFCLNEKRLNREKMKELLLAGTISIELIQAESANAILVSKNRGLVDNRTARAAIESMLELSANNIKMMRQNELISEAFEMAESYRASVYDLLYVSLAKRTSSSLASKDEKQKEIARKVKIKIEEI